MVITSYGLNCFKITSGSTVIAFDPPSKKSKNKSPYFQTDAVFISHDHEDNNGRDVLHPKDDGLFVVDGPGEYEYKNIEIIGIPSFHDSSHGKKYGRNTIYRVKFEDIILLHMGDFGEKEISSEIKEKINGVDILFIPIGGDEVIDDDAAAEIANQIEPQIIIPMHYPAKNKKVLNDFLDEMGAKGLKAEDKLTIKKKELSETQTKVVVLEPLI